MDITDGANHWSLVPQHGGTAKLYHNGYLVAEVSVDPPEWTSQFTVTIPGYVAVTWDGVRMEAMEGR